MCDNMLKISIGSRGRIVNFVLASKCSMGVLKFLNKIPKNAMNIFSMGKKFVESESINFKCPESESINFKCPESESINFDCPELDDLLADSTTLVIGRIFVSVSKWSISVVCVYPVIVCRNLFWACWSLFF